jgi:hypothetical protein
MGTSQHMMRKKMWTHHMEIKGSNKSLVFEGIPTSFFCLSPNLANSSRGWLPTHLLHKFGKKKKTLVLIALLSICEGRSKFVLFCFVVMRSTKLGCFKSCSWCLWKALNERKGASAWFHANLNLLCKSSWILNDFFTVN